jgi:hypothetical protein
VAVAAARRRLQVKSASETISNEKVNQTGHKQAYNSSLSVPLF